MASLQDQLLKAGIVNKKKAKQVEQEKRKQTKQAHKGHAHVDETKELAKKALAEKTIRDREINRQREKAAELKAITAQIKQLIEVNRIDRSNGEVAYQFTDGTKIKKIFVSPLLHSQLSKGLIAIVPFGVDDRLPEHRPLLPERGAGLLRSTPRGSLDGVAPWARAWQARDSPRHTGWRADATAARRR